MRKERGNRQMTEGFLEVFKDRSMSEASVRRYEQWKSKDILAMALETMPKQVKRKNADNSTKKLTSKSKQI
jgi:hypothetical protein